MMMMRVRREGEGEGVEGRVSGGDQWRTTRMIKMSVKGQDRG